MTLKSSIRLLLLPSASTNILSETGIEKRMPDIDHIVESLLDRYLTRKDISSSIVGIDCMLLRILAGVGL